MQRWRPQLFLLSRKLKEEEEEKVNCSNLLTGFEDSAPAAAPVLRTFSAACQSLGSK